jgi:hypothetical protein
MLQFTDSTMKIRIISIISCYLMAGSYEYKGRYGLIVNLYHLLNSSNIL